MFLTTNGASFGCFNVGNPLPSFDSENNGIAVENSRLKIPFLLGLVKDLPKAGRLRPCDRAYLLTLSRSEMSLRIEWRSGILRKQSARAEGEVVESSGLLPEGRYFFWPFVAPGVNCGAVNDSLLSERS